MHQNNQHLLTPDRLVGRMLFIESASSGESNQAGRAERGAEGTGCVERKPTGASDSGVDKETMR